MRPTYFTLLGLLIATSVPAADQAPLLEIKLNNSLIGALETSGRLESAGAETQAAESKAQSQESLLWPKLSFDATLRYVTEVPTLPIPGMQVPFGDNESYSIGPVLSWTLWDGGALRKGWRSQQSIASSRAEEKALAERQVTLAVRLTYFSVLQEAEQQWLVADSIRVAQARSRDIERRQRAGTASKIDAISARKEVLALQLKFYKAQTELSVALRDLFSLSGKTETADLSRPADARIKNVEELSGVRPTVQIKLESMALLMNMLGRTSEDKEHFDASVTKRHPKIRATAFQADSLRLAAEGASALHWPKLTLVAKSSLDYPNGPTLERVHQNSVGATLSWSLFEFGRVHYETAEKRSLAEAAEGRKRQLEIDLARDLRKTHDQIAALKEQRETHRLSIEQSEKLVDLIYQSYRAGRSSFLDVQNSNLAALNAKIDGRKNEIQILIQTAVLNEISGEK